MLKLYYSPGSCALASHIALEEAGATYETVRLDFSSDEQRKPAYLNVNPKGRVPALATEKGIVTETPAILAYIAQSFPAAKLAPVNDPFAFARVQEFNNYICATVHVAHAHNRRGYRWADEPSALEAMKKKVPQSVGAAYALIEEGMLAGPWVMGETYTICDPYLFTVSNWLAGDGADLSRLPRVMDHNKHMAERPAVKRSIAQETAAPAK
jgi:glutathione S-transferase